MSKIHQSMVKIPHPGSDEAIKQGCECPVLDNEHGRGLGQGEDGNPLFWINRDCPLHGHQKGDNSSG